MELHGAKRDRELEVNTSREALCQELGRAHEREIWMHEAAEVAVRED